MTVEYAIIAFPQLAFGDRVEALRQRFDPLADVLAAHITLVFPFAGEALAPQLAAHTADAATGIPPFAVELADPVVADSEYLFLHVLAGAARLAELHDRLYSGVLAPYRSEQHSFCPHITIGRSAAVDQLLGALRQARAELQGPLVGRISELVVFRVESSTRGAVYCTVPLASSP